MDKRNDCLLSSKDNKFCFHPSVMETRLEPAGDAGRRLQIDRGCANAARLVARPVNGQ
jgi:hypothetical protein